MNLLDHHLKEHATRGFGDSPTACPVCPHEHPELVKRIEALEGKGASAKWNQITMAVTGSVLAAFLVERFIKNRK